MTHKRLVAFISIFKNAVSIEQQAKICLRRALISQLILAPIFLGIFSWPIQVFAQNDDQNWNRSELVYGSQMPRNRERERQIEAAEKLIKAGRYSDAVRILQSLFEVPDDSILTDQTSLKAKATQLVADLPASGRRALRTIIEVPLGKEIQQAIDSLDRTRLAELAAQYPPEVLGQNAWVAWAWLERELGNQVFASAIIQELESSGVQVDGPSQLLGDLLESRRLFKERHKATINDGMETPRWLQRHSPQNWIAPQAESDRRFQMHGPSPTPWREWAAATCNSISDEREIEAARSRLAVNFSQLTAPNAIAVDGVVLFRQENKLVAIDADTGLRQWNVDLSQQDEPKSYSEKMRYYLGSFFAGQATDQAWLDRSRGTITSDSELVFAVFDVRQPEGESGNDARFFPWHRSGRRNFVNALAAFSIAEQGKRKWVIDGSDSTGSYYGYRFLGSPAAVEDYLAVLAERQGAIHFFLINASDGKLLWKQPISNRESNEFLPHLTLTGYTPIWNNGKFYCSAGSGVVAAINPMRRSIEWVSYLPVDETLKVMQMRRSQQIGLQEAERRIRTGEGWRSTGLFIYQDKLVVAPVESDYLACYDCKTGEMLWSEELKQGNLAVGVAETNDSVESASLGQVLILESNSVCSRSLHEGKELWRASLQGEEVPVGEGIHLGDSYLLPLNSGRLAYISLKRETNQRVVYERLLSGPLRSPVSLGNLLWHQGAIYSRSPSSLEKYTQPLSEDQTIYQADRALAKGDYEKADHLLERKSHSSRITEFDQQSRRDMAIGLATIAGERDALADDGSARSFSDDLYKLYPFKAKLFDLFSALNNSEAVTKDVELQARELLAMPESERTLLAVSPKHQVRADRWISGKLPRVPMPSASDQSRVEVNDHSFSPLWRSNQVSSSHWAIANQELAANQKAYYYSRQRNNVSRSLPVRSSDSVNLEWRYISNGNDKPRILCRDYRGEICFSRTMEDSLRTNFQSVNLGQPGPCYWKDLLYVQLDDSLQAIDVKSVDERQARVWTYDPAIFIDYQTIRFYDPTGVTKTKSVGKKKTSSNQIVPSIYWVDADGAIVRANGKLMALDPKSGELLWSQSDWKSYDRVFVHQDRIYLGKTSLVGKGKVLAKSDGRLLGEWYVPGNSWRLYHAGKLLVANRNELKLFDITKNERTPIWSAALTGNQYTLLEDQVFLLDSSRKLTCFDLTTGEVRYKTQLDRNLPSARVKSLSCFKRGGNLYVAVSSKNNTDLRQKGVTPIGQSPLISGHIYCLDQMTGESVWPQPIELGGMAVLDSLLPNSPLIAFASKKQKNEIDSNQGDYRVLVVNRWTGTTVYRNDNLPGERQSFVSVCELVEQYPTEAITLQIGRSQMRFELTEAVRPPLPPAMASIERHEPNRIGLTEFGEGIKKIFGGMTEPIEK